MMYIFDVYYCFPTQTRVDYTPHKEQVKLKKQKLDALTQSSNFVKLLRA